MNDREPKSPAKGFAGLADMVSEVETASPPKPPMSTEDVFPDRRTIPSKKPTILLPKGALQLGVFILLGVSISFWLTSRSGNKRIAPALVASPSVPAAQPLLIAPNSPQASEPSAIASDAERRTQPVAPKPPSRPVETQPSIGRNNVLSTAEIRYCLAEKIQLDAAETVLNNYVDSDVDRFNAYVNDYNSRCGEFRYRQGALESAQRDVEPYRNQLQAEGRSRFVRNPAAATRSQAPAQTPQPVRPAPDATVQAIQRRLNELGYDAGSADGLLGSRTRSAILLFQRDQGISQDGQPTAELLTRIAAFQSQSAELSTPQVPRQPSATSGRSKEMSSIDAAERSAIENVCGFYQRTEGPASYYNCLAKQLAQLSGRSGKPDLSRVSQSERQAIENVCGFYERTEGPASYYNCLGKQLSQLAGHGGKPDLSRVPQVERQSMENVCGFYQRTEGPASYYACLSKQLAELGYR